MKKVLLTCFLCFAIIVARTQIISISPDQTNEFSPNVEYTFTATIVFDYSSMIGLGGCYVTQLPTAPVGHTFTFKAKFADANQKQTFQINHPDGSYTKFEFKKIKSLFYPTSCAQVPNQTPVNVPRCQTVNIPISFTNVQWGANFENPTLCFGSITNYEYQLPNQWTLNGQTSTGSNWIAGTNSVTVTSDASNGVNGVILIRPKTVTAGLQNGQTPGQIPINRAAPTLTITGSQAICSGTSDYQVALPAGATIQWTLSGSDASIVGCSTCSTVTVSRNTSVDVSVVLTATVTDCIQTYPSLTKPIRLGKPSVDQSGYITDGTYYPIKIYNGLSSDYNELCKGHTAITQFSYAGETNVTWMRTFASPTNTVWWNYGDDIKLYFYALSQSQRFQMTATNACGSFVRDYAFRSKACSGGCLQYQVSPNPAANNINIIVPNIPGPCDGPTAFGAQENGNEQRDVIITEVRLYDNLGVLKKVKQVNKVKQLSLDVTALKGGVYFIEVTDGTYKETQQVIIQK